MKAYVSIYEGKLIQTAKKKRKKPLFHYKKLVTH